MAPPSADPLPTAATSGPTQSSQETGAANAKVKMPIPKPPVFDDKLKEREYLKGRLAAAFRIFGKNGYDEGVAGHITLRDPVDPTTFWVNPFGVSFSQIKASDLIQVDHSGAVIAGGPCRLLNAAAFMIHSAIHAARPDVLCAAHSHSLYGRAFCTLGRELDIITQDSCAFYNDHILYKQFNGVVLAEEEGRNIASALGNKKAALLQNHGLLTVGKTIEETVFWFVSLEKCCHAQLLADAAAAGRGGTTVKIDDADAAFTYKAVGTSLAGYFSAKPLFDVVHEETGGAYLD
ncbi:class II aldolase/adducin N-terminal [Aspergillus aurantiobrunneus]